MTRIIKNVDCGNSPKNSFIQEFEAAFAAVDIDQLVEWVSDDIRWIGVGQTEVHDVDNFEGMLMMMKPEHIEEYVIEGAISHGDQGCAWGRMTEANGAVYEFCDVFSFENHKAERIKEIKSFSICVDSSD